MSDDITVDEGAGRSGVSRRTVLKGAAVVGGTLWVAPAIESFTSKAYAATASAGTPNVCLSGISSISWLALVIEDTDLASNNKFLVKLDSTACGAGYLNPPSGGDWTSWWGTTQSFPCGGSSTWQSIGGFPTDVQSGAPPTDLITSVSCTYSSGELVSMTITLASDAAILQEEEHGGALPAGTGSTCEGTTFSSPIKGTVTFYANSTGSC